MKKDNLIDLEILEILNQADNLEKEHVIDEELKDNLGEEILDILAQADEVSNEQLLIDDKGEILSIDEMKQIIVSDTDDPDRKYELYYNGIQRLLRKGLPKGKNNKKVRDIVREEVKTFLTRGKRKVSGTRGADSRMGYVSDMEIALHKIIYWSRNRGTPTELYKQFLELNKKKQK